MHNGWIITMPCPECKSKSKNHKDHSVAILMEEGKQLTFRTKKSALEYIRLLPVEWQEAFNDKLSISNQLLKGDN